jgi:hypothetical protein
MKSDSGAIRTSLESINRLIASEKSTKYALLCRASALERLAEDVDKFIGWPALSASLRASAREVLEERSHRVFKEKSKNRSKI